MLLVCFFVPAVSVNCAQSFFMSAALDKLCPLGLLKLIGWEWGTLRAAHMQMQ